MAGNEALRLAVGNVLYSPSLLYLSKGFILYMYDRRPLEGFKQGMMVDLCLEG